MGVEENKALVRHWFEELDKGNLDVMDEVLDSAIVFQTVEGSELHSCEEVKRMGRAVFSFLPDVRFTVHDLVAEGDKVVARWAVSGTHTGEWGDVLPTGNSVTNWWIGIYRIASGKIVEAWERFDTYGWRKQLGALPASE
jgi:predicted ester cyclase